MQYRAFKLQELSVPYKWTFKTAGGSIKEFVNSDTLAYAAGGACATWKIDNDYLLSNNSTINITAETRAVPGQLIVMIDDAGQKNLGVITGVDNKNLQIIYKNMLDIFDCTTLNPMRAAMSNDGEEFEVKYLYDGVEDTAQILAMLYASKDVDKYRRLPIRIRTSGGGRNESGGYNVPAIWKYADNTFNIKEWLVDLFNTHNVVVQFKLVFEVSRAYIEIYVAHNTSGGRLIKNNIHGMTLTHSEDTAAKATVCQVVDNDTKALLSTWYLLRNNTVTSDASATDRVQPYKLTVSEFDADNDDGATEQSVAEDALLYGDFNHYISVEIDKNSAMYPQNLKIGDSVTVVPEIEEMTSEDALNDDYENKVMRSIYTGKQEDSENSIVTLIFGKIRINYTDIIQMQYQKKARS